MDDNANKQQLLNSKKSKSITIIVILELKVLITELAKRNCKTASAFITALLGDKVLRRA